MIKNSITLTGDRDIALRFEQFPERLREKLRAAIGRVLPELAAAEQAAAPRRTGALASEIGATEIQEGPNFIRGIVGMARGLPGREYGKAGAEEYGAHREIIVRKPGVRALNLGLKRLRKSHPDKLYTRTVNIIERRYIRGPFAAMRGQIQDELADAVNEAVRESELV